MSAPTSPAEYKSATMDRKLQIRAWALQKRQEGTTLKSLANQIGVAHQRVSQWVNPTRYRTYNLKRNASRRKTRGDYRSGAHHLTNSEVEAIRARFSEGTHTTRQIFDYIQRTYHVTYAPNSRLPLLNRLKIKHVGPSAAPDPPAGYLHHRKFAALHGVSTQTIINRCAQGVLPHRHVGPYLYIKADAPTPTLHKRGRKKKDA